MTLALGEHDEEACVRLMVPSRPREETRIIERAIAAAPRAEQAGGLMDRGELLEALAERLAIPSPGGMRCVALVKIDKFAALERVIGARMHQMAAEPGAVVARSMRTQ